MRILETALFPPHAMSGGGLVVLQSVQSLASFADVDLICGEGPDVQLPDNVRRIGLLTHAHVSLSRLRILLFQHRYNGYVGSMQKIEQSTDLSQYDVFHAEGSSSPIGIDTAVRLGKPVIVRLHNIERDVEWNALHQQGLTPVQKVKRYLKSWLPTIVCERRVMSMRGNVMFAFLTERDLQRAMALYAVPREQSIVIPVCVPGKEVDLSEKNPEEPFTVLFTGSFWYHPNKEGLVWFIEQVWSGFRKKYPSRNCRLVLAGYQPDAELLDLCRKYGIDLVDSPADLGPYFQEADLCVAPLLSGAGMKVKVADALSWGVPVLGTEEALIGYEVDNDSVIQADSAQEFIEALERCTVSRLTPEKKQRALSLWRDNYSPQESCRLYKEAVERLLSKENFR